MTIKAYTEEQIRKMRAAIYGDISDESWLVVRDNWMRRDSIQWLLEKQPKGEK